MQNITSNLYDCNHCGGKGTCRNGREGISCAACVVRNELKGKDHIGLLCGSCGGIGKAEPMTERINKRTAPLLAIYLVIVLLILIAFASIFKSEHFSELLTFSSTIIGSVIGFYFSRRD